jgi:hypothetical protein
LSLINEGYIFIRGSTWISWDKVSGQTREGLWMSSDVLLMGGFRRVQMGGLGVGMGGWVDLWNGWMGGFIDGYSNGNVVR